MKNEQNIKQSAIEKLTLIANEEFGVQLTKEEVDYLGITNINDESIVKEENEDE